MTDPAPDGEGPQSTVQPIKPPRRVREKMGDWVGCRGQWRECRRRLHVILDYLLLRLEHQSPAWRRAKKLKRYNLEGRADAYRVGHKILGLLLHLRCDCHQVPHTETCNTMKRLHWEVEFLDAWQMTRHTKHPPEGVTHEKAADDDGGDVVSIIPRIRGSGGA